MNPRAWVYITSNRPNGVLYIGCTTDLSARARRHRSGKGSGFTSKYNCTRLVYFEEQPSIEAARPRERAMKAWKRGWKVRIIEELNPEWEELVGLPER